MAKKQETRLQKKIRQTLEREVGGWWFKVWVGPFQQAGIPDIIGCVEGLFFALEVKVKPTDEPSAIQVETIQDIREHGGAVAEVVRSPQEAVRIVRRALRRTRAVPTKRSRLLPQRQDGGAVSRTRHGKNVGNAGRSRTTTD